MAKEKLRKPLDPNDPRVKFQLWQVRNPDQWERPRGPNDTLHQRDEPEVEAYAKGGGVRARDATRGAFRTGGSSKQPDFAAGGGMLNKKSYSKGDT